MSYTPPTIDEMLEVLRGGLALVTFNKKDGSSRLMRATLHVETAAAYGKVLDGRQFEGDDHDFGGRIVAWDVDRGEWRAFYADRVTDFRVGECEACAA